MRAHTLAIALLASISVLASCDTATGPLRLGVAGSVAGYDDLFSGHHIGVLVVAAVYDALVAVPVFRFVNLLLLAG